MILNASRHRPTRWVAPLVALLALLALLVALLSPLAGRSAANAQTIPSPTITLSSRAFGAPAGVTGVSITVSCRQLLGGAYASVTYAVKNGSAPLPTYWPLSAPTATPYNTGTNCVVSASVTGTANLDKGQIAISVGGADRTIDTNTVTTPVLKTTTINSGVVNNEFIGGLPVFSSTEVVVTLKYPHVTVQKSVYGAEPNQGFSYPMSIRCSASGSDFVYGTTFSLSRGYYRVFTIDDFPGMTTTSMCDVQETNSNGAPRVTYSSTVVNPDGTTSSTPGVGSGAAYRSALTQSGQTITVVADFIHYGDLVVRVVTAGDPGANASSFEIQVACNNGGPKSTFVLSNGASATFSNIVEGTSCQVLETKSNGAIATYFDNSGSVTNDGRVSIPSTSDGCPQAGPARCTATVVITNEFNSSAGRYVPVTPSRVVDTRYGLGTSLRKMEAGETLALQIGGNAAVPTSARTAALNVTVTDPSAPGHLTVYPCDSPRPTTSNLNFVPGQTVANLAVVRISGQGQVCVYASASTHVLADVFGYYDTIGQGFKPVTPNRIVDSRVGNGLAMRKMTDGEVVAVQVTGRGGVPSGAAGALLNLTVTEPNAAGWIAVYRCDTPRPPVSNINFEPGQTLANLVYGQLDSQGRTCIYASVGTHVVMDISGYFGATFDVTGYPLATVLPARILDTRIGLAAPVGRLAAGQTLALSVRGAGGIPGNAITAVLNVTATNTLDAGHLTVFSCDEGRPNASTLNFVAGATVPNLTETRISGFGQVCIYASAATDLIVDATGYR